MNHVNGPLRSLLLTASLLLSLLFIAGCGRTKTIEFEYGKREGSSFGRSVNGTGVFAGMFEQLADARVRSTKRLGRTVLRSEVLVWIPDCFSPPQEDAREFIEDWLLEGDGRTFIYVGRDFDAATAYWDEAIPLIPMNKSLDARREEARRKAQFAIRRGDNSQNVDCDWFQLITRAPKRRVTNIDGPWSHLIDPEKADIWLQSRIEPSESITNPELASFSGVHGTGSFEPLLTSHGDVLIAKYQRKNWGSNKILLMANGSWVLNFPLLNHEHRKLAGAIIAECGDVDQVVFLESGPAGPSIHDTAPNKHHGLTAFTVWPVNCILIHATLLGLLFCFSAFPIFGRPKSNTHDQHSDFGKHVQAMGELMAQTHDREYALRQRTIYQQRVSHEVIAPETIPVASVKPTISSPTSTSIEDAVAPERHSRTTSIAPENEA